MYGSKEVLNQLKQEAERFSLGAVTLVNQFRVSLMYRLIDGRNDQWRSEWRTIARTSQRQLTARTTNRHPNSGHRSSFEPQLRAHARTHPGDRAGRHDRHHGTPPRSTASIGVFPTGSHNRDLTAQMSHRLLPNDQGATRAQRAEQVWRRQGQDRVLAAAIRL